MVPADFKTSNGTSCSSDSLREGKLQISGLSQVRVMSHILNELCTYLIID
jgi:hypothetical protein